MGKTSELLSLLKTGNSDAARRLITKFKKAGKKKALAKELNVPDDNGQTVIHFCAAQNFVEFLHDLAELGASVDLADNKGYTPLHLAAASGRTSAVTAVISMGADPNISSRTGDTPLHLACHGGHATSVEKLVAENGNCTMLNVSGYTPLDLACQSGHTQVVSLLLRSGQFSPSYLQRSDMPHTALMLAAKQGHNECISLLVKHGFDVNRKLPGGNGGTALHEAALNGKVDTVRYLIQCGVDVQKTNSQGHTALDIVNMYTDPRTASIMKQVLQDALARLARSRIAQQHVGHHATSHQPPPPTFQQQPAGFSYFPHPGQPMTHRQMPEESPQHRQHPVPGQRQVPSGSTGYPHHHPKGESGVHPSLLTPGQVPPYQLVGQSHLATGHPRQVVGHTAHMQQTTGHQSASSRPPSSQSHAYVAVQRHHMGQQPPAQVHQQHRLVNRDPENPGIDQPPPPQNVQHIYPKPGTPEAARKAPGIGGDLAAIIAAKAASRKPIPTSPTRKNSVDDQLHRSMTGGEPGMQQARPPAQPRRSSLSERSSVSPERGDVANPPMLPRRAQAGPPSFKPVPPPSEGSRVQAGLGSDVERNAFQPNSSSSELEWQQSHKLQHEVPPPASEDNELMAKLKRRQNKIIEAEQAETEQVMELEEAEERDEEPAPSKPPPPPQRKTPALNSVAPSTAPPQQTSEEPPLKQKKGKPPPPKPKEVEPEMSPWQQELAARRARMADHEQESEQQQEGVEDGGTHDKAPSPAPVRKPAPKPKRSKVPPPVTKQLDLISQEQPLPANPPLQNLARSDHSVEPESGKLSSEVSPVNPTIREPTIVVAGGAGDPPLPSEVSTLVVDQLSRSTSMSSLTAGAGLPQFTHVEHMPVLEWLTSYKLADYAPVLEGNGYETTELMLGMTHEELQDMGITKIGHRKKLISALASWSPKEHLLQVKPESVSVWLNVLHMSQYETTFIEAGYDDIEFVCDMTLDDLLDIGITKKGHVKRLLQGIGELTDLIKSSPTRTSDPLTLVNEVPDRSLPPTSVEPPPDRWRGGDDSRKVDFSRMRGLLEMKMGVNPTTEESAPVTQQTSDPQGHFDRDLASDIPPEVPSKNSRRPIGEEAVDAGSPFSVEDITAGLGEDKCQEKVVHGGTKSEFDQLGAVLQGLGDEEEGATGTEPESEPDQLLADIDDMLADLTTHLDFMIPGST